MTQEEKEILIKDICCRLPYGVKAYVRHYSKLDRKWYEGIYTIESIHPSLNDIFVCSERGSVEVIVGYDDYEIKPYLLPMSSMTEEQRNELEELCNMYTPYDDYNPYAYKGIQVLYKHVLDNGYEFNFETDVIDWFHRNHFDYRGLIEKDLASDATYLNIY